MSDKYRTAGGTRVTIEDEVQIASFQRGEHQTGMCGDAFPYVTEFRGNKYLSWDCECCCGSVLLVKEEA